jgi:cytochrome c-type biogenesis protein CcmH
VSGRARWLVVGLAGLALAATLWWRAEAGSEGARVATVHEVAATLRCPSCAGESAADSAAPTARGMRVVIAQRLAAGESPGQIRAHFVDRYGEGILLDPPREGIGWLLVVLPAAAVAGGVLAVAVLVARRRPPPRPALTEGERGRAEQLVAAAGSGPSPGDERLAAALQLLGDVRSDPDAGGRRSRVEDELLAEILRWAPPDRPEDPVPGAEVATPDDARGSVTADEAAADGARPDDATPAPPPAPRRRRSVVAVPVAAVVLVGAVTVAAVVQASEQAAPAGAPADPSAAVAAEPADALLRQARALDDAGRLPEAVTAYRAVLEERPGDAATMVALAFALVRSDRPDEAVPLLQTVMAAHPDHPDAVLMLGMAQRARGDAEGTATLRRFLDLAPDHPAAAAVRDLLEES